MIKIAVLLAAVLSVAACSGGSLGPPEPQAPPAPTAVGPAGTRIDARRKPQYVYWSLYSGSNYAAIQYAKAPVTRRSKPISIDGHPGNTLYYTSGLGFDSSGRFWVLIPGKDHFNPTSVSVFELPLTSSSTPEYTFVLSGSDAADHLRFDGAGNLWVTSPKNNSVLEYTGPFNQSGTLTPAITLTDGLNGPEGLSFDVAGNLYVSNNGSTGTGSIAVFAAPVSNKQPYFLNGLNKPGGLIFDKSGNLYASSNASSQTATVRYNANDLSSGDTPSIVDSAGLSGTYEADFALSKNGDLYFANCGSIGSIVVYKTSKYQFSSTLAPSVNFTDPDLTQAGCAWGIAIK